MTTASDAYNQGFNAGYNYDSPLCPYNNETQEDLYHSWHSGYNDWRTNMTTTSDAYNQGFEAGYNYEYSSEECPYDNETQEDLYHMWHSGYENGQDAYRDLRNGEDVDIFWGSDEGVSGIETY